MRQTGAFAEKGLMSAPHILFIDDDPFDQALVRSAFQRIGSTAVVDVVPDVGVAIGHLESRRLPSIVVVDLKLQFESGLELIEWVRAQKRLSFLPIIVLSGSDAQDDVRAAYEAGANAYLIKGQTLEEIELLARRIDAFWLNAASLVGLESPGSTS